MGSKVSSFPGIHSVPREEMFYLLSINNKNFIYFNLYISEVYNYNNVQKEDKTSECGE